MFFKNKIKIFLIYLFLFSPFLASADGIVPCGNNDQSPCTLCHFIIGIFNLITWGRNILIVVAVVAIFISGILYMISSGTQLMEQAKRFLTASIVGFVIVITSWLIIATVMWALSAQPDLGIGKTGANFQTGSITFDCNSQSTIGNQGGNGTSTLNVNNSGQGGGGGGAGTWQNSGVQGGSW